MSVLKKLASFNHPYYCSESNYFSNDAAMSYDTMQDFLDEWKDADKDYNLIFRWDIKLAGKDNENNSERTEPDTYYAEVFYMLQRKGKYVPVMIKSVNEEGAIEFEKLLKDYWEHLKNLWAPVSGMDVDNFKGD